MRVALVSPPLNVPALTSQLEPLGLGYIGAVCRAAGHEVELHDLISIQSADLDDFFRRLDRFRPDVVGITAMSEMFPNGVAVARAVKARYGCTTVFGGWHVSGDPSEVRDPAIDFVVVGEGEETILELLQHLQGSSIPLATIAGLAYKVPDGHRVNEARRRNRVLDALPRPIRDGLPIDRYKFGFIFQHTPQRNRTLSVQASRGCPYKCTFCQTPTVLGNLWASRSAVDVVDEIVEMTERHPTMNTLFFRDEEFTIRPKWVHEICNEMVRRGVPKKVSWGAFGRVDDLSDDLGAALHAAGCRMLIVGIEGTDSESTQRVQKNYKIDEVVRACEIMTRHEIISHGGWIIGYPWDTREKLEKAFQWILALELDFLEVYFAVPFKGTKLGREVEEAGLLLHTDPARLTCFDVSIHTPAIPADELRRMRDGFYRRFMLRPRQLRRFVRHAVRRPERFLIGAQYFTTPGYWARYFLTTLLDRSERVESFEIPARFHAPLRRAERPPIPRAPAVDLRGDRRGLDVRAGAA